MSHPDGSMTTDLPDNQRPLPAHPWNDDDWDGFPNTCADCGC